MDTISLLDLMQTIGLIRIVDLATMPVIIVKDGEEIGIKKAFIIGGKLFLTAE